MYSITVLEDGNQGVEEPRFLQSLQEESAPCLPPFLYLARLCDLWEFLDREGGGTCAPCSGRGWSPKHCSTSEISLPPSSVPMLLAVLGFPGWPRSPSSRAPLMRVFLCIFSSSYEDTCHMILGVHSTPYHHFLAHCICKESISPYNHIRGSGKDANFGERKLDTLSTQCA